MRAYAVPVSAGRVVDVLMCRARWWLIIEFALRIEDKAACVKANLLPTAEAHMREI
jgi:hypothetical protein